MEDVGRDLWAGETAQHRPKKKDSWRPGPPPSRYAEVREEGEASRTEERTPQTYLSGGAATRNTCTRGRLLQAPGSGRAAHRRSSGRWRRGSPWEDDLDCRDRRWGSGAGPGVAGLVTRAARAPWPEGPTAECHRNWAPSRELSINLTGGERPLRAPAASKSRSADNAHQPTPAEESDGLTGVSADLSGVRRAAGKGKRNWNLLVIPVAPNEALRGIGQSLGPPPSA
ncbi:hypothetical protein NDU88_004946 [Pleurodeles waltl]|uniref:Uncharacterized protein n=1 Tax=Pleurodeles waltl TaxID=8319 RepID=A0AAV7W6P5_PLEWA|nr:hypothetical protein NDU88_004946 [Pleurodeles waltl]